MRSIWVSEAVLSMVSVIFVLLCSHAGWTALASSLAAAVTLWLMIPVPLLITNAIYIPIDRRIVVSHSLGWLARLVLTALCVSLLL